MRQGMRGLGKKQEAALSYLAAGGVLTRSARGFYETADRQGPRFPLESIERLVDRRLARASEWIQSGAMQTPRPLRVEKLQ